MKKGILALAFLPFLLVGDERVILSPADRGELTNVHVAPLDHAGVGVEYHPPFATGGGSSLLANLLAYWKMDEASGDRADSSGAGLTLTDNNTVGVAAGKIGNTASFVHTNLESLSRIVGPGELVAPEWTVAGWVAGSAVGTGYWCERDGGAANDKSFALRVLHGGGTQSFIAYAFTNDATAVSIQQTARLAAVGTLQHIVVTFGADLKLRLYVDTVLEATSGVLAGGTYQGASVFEFGRGRIASGYFTGLVDEALVASRAWDATDVALSYNGGAGRTHPFS